HRVLVLAHLLDQADHARGRVGVGAAHGRGLHLLEGDGGGVGHPGDHVAHLLDVADDAHPVAGEQLAGDGAGGHAADGLAGAAAAATPVVAPSVLGVEGEVGVAGPVLVGDVGVIL